MTLRNSSFTRNTASEQGGAINYDYKPPVRENNIFENNNAAYGNNIASYPVTIKLINSNSEEIRLSEIRSGAAIDTPVVLSLMDYDNQVMNLDNENQVSIFSSNTTESSVRGTNTVKLNNGLASFDSIIFVSEPGSTNIEFSATSKSINRAKIASAIPGFQLENPIKVDFRY